MSTQGDYLTEIADAIRAKEGSSDPIPANTFAQRISKITTGYDTSDATAAAAQILAPYTAYGASGKITGTIPTQQGKTITPGTSNQTAVASGRYTTGDVVVSGDANLVPENIAEGVSIFGVQGTHSGGGGGEVVITYSQQISIRPQTTITLPLSDYVTFQWSSYKFALFPGMTSGEISIGDAWANFAFSSDGVTLQITRTSGSTWGGSNTLTGYKYK